jgi:replicative DNA helicase
VPFNREAEEAVVGSVIIYADIFPSLADVLKPADFYIRRHGWIWEAFSRLTARGEPIDYRTACDELARMGQLEEVGGAAYLTVLVNQVPSSLNAETYARTVIECATRRGLIAAANQIATLAFDPTRDISDVMAGSLEALQSQAAGPRALHPARCGVRPRAAAADRLHRGRPNNSRQRQCVLW